MTQATSAAATANAYKTLYNSKFQLFLGSSGDPDIASPNLAKGDDGSGRQVWKLDPVGPPGTYVVSVAGWPQRGIRRAQLRADWGARGPICA